MLPWFIAWPVITSLLHQCLMLIFWVNTHLVLFILVGSSPLHQKAVKTGFQDFKPLHLILPGAWESPIPDWTGQDRAQKQYI